MLARQSYSQNAAGFCSEGFYQLRLVMDIAVSMPGMLLPDLHESIDASIDAASKKKPAPIMLPGFRFNPLCHYVDTKPCLAFRTLPLLHRGSRRHAEVCKSFSSNASPHHLTEAGLSHRNITAETQ
jgi:hypothetical protein